jgi:hypothetical protein
VLSLKGALYSSSGQESFIIAPAYSLIFALVEITVTFSVFFVVGKRTNTKVVKTVVLSLLSGMIVGQLILLLQTNLSGLPLEAIYTNVYISFLTGFVPGTLFQLFFPALGALLYAELKQKRTNNF